MEKNIHIPCRVLRRMLFMGCDSIALADLRFVRAYGVRENGHRTFRRSRWKSSRKSCSQTSETVGTVCVSELHKFTSPFRRQIVGSRETALETILVLRQVVSKARFSNIDQLVEIIRAVGRKLVGAQPKGMIEPLPADVGSKSPLRIHGRKYRS